MKPRILIVDDLESSLRMMKRALRDEYAIDTAMSLQEAVAKLRSAEAPYHVVITDIGLSEGPDNRDGYEVLKEVQRLSKTTATIAISGRPAHVDQELFRKKYRALVYLDREILADDRDAFVDWVSKGVKHSLELIEESTAWND